MDFDNGRKWVLKEEPLNLSQIKINLNSHMWLQTEQEGAGNGQYAQCIKPDSHTSMMGYSQTDTQPRIKPTQEYAKVLRWTDGYQWTISWFLQYHFLL